MQQGVDTNIQKQREVPRLLERSVQTSVAFYVQLSHNHTIVYARAVPYDIVSVNQGNGYDKVSHVFRAPKAGLYFFTNTVMSTPGHSIKVEIEKNGVTIGKNQADTNGYESGTVSVIVQLSVHDNVWVRYPGYTKAQLAQDYNSFSGFLISAN
ncbi:C1QL [Mytilus coruscus]|uniref:C1QL n=1 Tax=Mytilus coruscus TaxID=42192 RepID=A0A6J8ALT9_MYTCO|nr:C1QL [Mytilus coruscus]